MKIICIETSRNEICLSYLNKNYILSKTVNKHSKRTICILNIVSYFIKKTKISEIDMIVICYGPGNFVGTRLSVSIVQGLILPYNIPTIYLSLFNLYMFYCDPLKTMYLKGNILLINSYNKKTYLSLFRSNLNGFISLSLDTIKDLNNFTCLNKIKLVVVFGDLKITYKNIILKNNKNVKILFLSNISVPKSSLIIKISHYINQHSYFYKKLNFNDLMPVYVY